MILQMVLNSIFYLFLGFAALFAQQNLPHFPHSIQTDSSEGCTIGIAAGKSTPDGRPLIWKIRDNATAPINNILTSQNGKYNFIAVVTQGSTDPWMGVNEKGFAILNSTARDLPGGATGFNNAGLMGIALSNCASVSEFVAVLDSSNETGRQTRANFAVMDAAGKVKLFETAGNTYWAFDADDPEQAPNGFIVRTNFAINGGGSTGRERFKRSNQLISDYYLGDSLSVQSLLKHHFRDFSDDEGIGLHLPFAQQWQNNTRFGYLNSNKCISRYKSVSSTVIQGITDGESAKFTTMWTQLGQPTSTIALPFFPIGMEDILLSNQLTAQLNQTSNRIRSYLFDDLLQSRFFDTYKYCNPWATNIQHRLLTLEDSLFTVCQQKRAEWQEFPPNAIDVIRWEEMLVSTAIQELSKIEMQLKNTVRDYEIRVFNKLPFLNEKDQPLAAGSIVLFIWAGKNGKIDPPINNIGSSQNGMPTGDDQIIYPMHRIGERLHHPGELLFKERIWPEVSGYFPQMKDGIYLRLFNADTPAFASRYGDSYLYEISDDTSRVFDPVINGGQVNRSLKIDISDLSVKYWNQQVKISWHVKWPVENAQFIIEYGADTTSFEIIAVYNANDLEPIPDDGYAGFRYNVTQKFGSETPDGYYRLLLLDALGESNIFGPVIPTASPAEFISALKLHPNYPNPFNRRTQIEINVPGSGDMKTPVELMVFDNLGRIVRKLVSGRLTGGKHNFSWDGKSRNGNPQPSGIYFLRLKSGKQIKTQKLLFIN